MYNSEQKLKFINDQASSMADYYTSFFNTFEIYEEDNGLDVSVLPHEVIQDVFNTEFGVKKYSVKQMINALRTYNKWCSANNLPAYDNYSNIKIDSSDKIRKTMLSSPMHLSMVLDDIYSPVEENTMDCIYRAFAWLIFAGMHEIDATNILIEDIDWDNMLVHYGGKTYDIYKEAVPSIKKACNLNEVVYVHPKYKENTIRNRVSNNYVFRGVRSEHINIRTFRVVLQEATKKSSMTINHRSIFWSGVFYRQYELERAGSTPDFRRLAEIDILKKQKKNPDKAIDFNKSVSRAKCSYQSDYTQWKNAFAK